MNNNIKWAIDQAHSSINFKIRHLMIAHIRGQFRKFDASIYTNNNDFTTAEIDVWIDASSIDTGNSERDQHLKGPDFLDVANYPQISFVSGTVSKQDDDGKHVMWGDLTIKGVSRAVKMVVEFGGVIESQPGLRKSGFLVDGKINRSDWGIIFNAPLLDGGVMVGEEVRIECEVELQSDKNKEQTMELEERTKANHIL